MTIAFGVANENALTAKRIYEELAYHEIMGLYAKLVFKNSYKPRI